MSLLLLYKPSPDAPKLRGLGVAQQAPGSRVLDASVTLTGGSAQGESGNLTADVAGTRNLTPLGVNQQARTFDLKGVGESQVELIGAQANAQGEELEGVSVFITLDGAGAEAQAGSVGLAEQDGRPSPSFVTRKGKKPRYIIEVDGEFVEVTSPQHAERVFQDIRDLALEAAQAQTETIKVIPRVSIKTAAGQPTRSLPLQNSLQNTQDEINSIYRAANDRIRRDKEISELISARIQEENIQDEDDALLAILLD